MSAPFASSFVSSLSSAWLALLADSAVKGVAVLVAAYAATLALRRASAATRHLAWFLAMASLPALPVLSVVLPAWRVLPAWVDVTQTEALHSPRAAPVPTPPEPVGAAGPRAFPPPAAPGGATPGADRASEPVAITGRPVPTEAPPAPLERERRWWSAAGLRACGLLAWALGAAASLAPVVLGAMSLRRLGRSARRVTDGPWADLLQLASAQAGLKRRVVLLHSERRSMPMAWGVLRPRLLVPHEAQGWSRECLRAVLLHELAHIKRWDCLTQLVARVACGLYWFNPLAWVALRRMTTEHERACDDAVLAAGGRAPEYAEHLLNVASRLRAVPLAMGAAIALARPARLEGRLLAILDPARSRRAVTRAAALAATVALLGLVAPLAALRGAADEGTARADTSSPPDREAGSRPHADGPKGSRQICVFALRYAQAESVASVVGDAFGSGRAPTVRCDRGHLVVVATPDQMARIAALVEQLDALAAADAAGAQPRPPATGITLDLRGQGFTDADLARVAQLPKLQTLYLSGSGITDAGLGRLKAAKGLEILGLVCMPKITDAGLQEICGMGGLRELWLVNVGVSDAGLARLAGLQRLEALRLSGPRIADAGLKALAGLKGLREVRLLGPSFTDEGMKDIGRLDGLRALGLINTAVTDAGLAELKALAGLQELDLAGTGITQAGLKALTGLDGLRSLGLRYTKITDAAMRQVKAFQALQHLDITYTNVTDAGLTELAELGGLRELRCVGAAVTRAGVDRLRRALPGAQIIAGSGAGERPSVTKPADQALRELTAALAAEEQRLATAEAQYKVGRKSLEDVLRQRVKVAEARARLAEEAVPRSPASPAASRPATRGEVLKQLQAVVALEERLLATVELRYRVGKASAEDVARQQVKLAQARGRLAAEEAQQAATQPSASRRAAVDRVVEQLREVVTLEERMLASIEQKHKLGKATSEDVDRQRLRLAEARVRLAEAAAGPAHPASRPKEAP